MSEAMLDLAALPDYLMRADHQTLVGLARALMLEVIARGLPCDDACSHLVEGLRRSTSTPRAAKGAQP